MDNVALLAEGGDRNRASWTTLILTTVALLAEGVDRNIPLPLVEKSIMTVALLAEGVDRNNISLKFSAEDRVALLAEGVDRNLIASTVASTLSGRPPRGGRG